MVNKLTSGTIFTLDFFFIHKSYVHVFSLPFFVGKESVLHLLLGTNISTVLKQRKKKKKLLSVS